MAIKFKTKTKTKTKTNYLTQLNYNKLKNPMFREFVISSPEDNSKYITLQRTGCVEHYDDNEKFLGDEFTVNIKDLEIFIPANASLFTFKMGNEIYGFKINYDI